MAKNNANESIQSIKYSVAMMQNPAHPEEPQKAYANIQLNGIVSLGQLAQHIREHGSPYTRDVILGVITAIVDLGTEKTVTNQVGRGMEKFFHKLFALRHEEALSKWE